MKVLHVVGARPNFMKVAPVLNSLKTRAGIEQLLVHTGQHYDAGMSDVFFEQLGLPAPDVNLAVGSGTHARQTAEIMVHLEPVIEQTRPNFALVYGDVNSTVAAALVCAKLCVPMAHVEAGLRSFDRSMPEEVNRVVTDQLASLLFTPSPDADANLQREGIVRENIHLVGNVMIDSLVRLMPLAQSVSSTGFPERYALVTLHRPANVDDLANLQDIVQSLIDINRQLHVVFAVHPRTRARIDQAGISVGKLQLLDPVPYVEFLAMQSRATVVITDSGGIQEETTYMGVPCLTMRENTERPVTVSKGTNVLVGRDRAKLMAELHAILQGRAKRGSIPPLWDGRAGERIADILCGS